MVAGFVAVAIGALAVPAAPAVAEDAPTPTSSASGKITFVLGIKQDIDSLNPYVGVTASAYEAYQLMYDYLIESSDAGLLAGSGPGRAVGDLRRRQDLDVPHPPGSEVVRRA